MSMVSIGTLIGPPLSGWLTDVYGHILPFILAAMVLVVDGMLRIIFIQIVPSLTDDPATTLDVLRTRSSRSVVILICFGVALITAIEPILPSHLANVFAMKPTDIGLMFALLVVIGAIFNPIVGALVNRISPRLLSFIDVGLAALGLLQIGLGAKMGWFISGLAFLGVSMALLTAPVSVLIGVQGMNSNPPALDGAYSLYYLAYAARLLIVPTVSRVLAGLGGYDFAYMTIAASLIIGAVAIFPLLPSVLIDRHKV